MAIVICVRGGEGNTPFDSLVLKATSSGYSARKVYPRAKPIDV